MKNNTIAIYAGSFDPFTIGHLSILERALNIFSKVIVAIGTNPQKKNSGLFSVFDRIHIIKASIPDHLTDRVEVRDFDVLLINFANKIKEENPNSNITIIRGLRSFQDFESEIKLFEFNNKHGFDTIPLFSQSAFNDVSSSTFKELWSFKEKELAYGYVTSGARKYIHHYSDHHCSDTGLICHLYRGTNTTSAAILKNEIVKNLFGKDRFYHNWLHPIELWENFLKLDEEFKLTKMFIVDSRVVNLAILYHDVIYDTRATNGKNEEESFKFMENQLKYTNLCYSKDDHGRKLDCTGAQIKEAILGTTHKDIQFENPNTNLMLDLDLLGFAKDYEEVIRAGDQIRKEYHWVDEKMFNMARAEIMKSFAGRKNLYRTPEIKAMFEAKAKENLNKEYTRYLNAALLD